MKILLVQPPFTIFKSEAKKCHPPLGLAYLSAVLADSHEVKVLDAIAQGYNRQEYIDKSFFRYGLSFEDIKKNIERLKPDIIGISCLFSAQSENAHAICRVAKEVDSRIITVLGGAHPTALPRETLIDKNVDFVIIGEAEEALKELVERLDKSSRYDDIEGIGFRCNSQIKINQRTNYFDNLDKIPFPRWDIFPLERYFEINNPHGACAKRGPFLPVITSRGCPFECVFCSIHSIWGRKHRTRSAQNVLAEINYLKSRFGVKEIMFEDDNLTLDYNRAAQIFQRMICDNLGMIWTTPNGIAVQTLDEKMLELMRNSGCYRVSIGVESGDENILKNIIRKPIMLSRVKPIINKARRVGMETVLFFVVGLPQEDRDSLKKTFRLAEGLGADNVNFFFATPLPGTRLLEECKNAGLIDRELDYARLKSDFPYFNTKFLNERKLASLVNRERLKLQILYLLRHPGKSVYKIWHKFINEPVRLFKLRLKYTYA